MVDVSTKAPIDCPEPAFSLARLRGWKAQQITAACYALVIAAAVLFGVRAFTLPFHAYLSALSLDDSFYYDEIARNFAIGRFSTFDGVHLTNGYHPLWATVLTPVFAFCHDPVLAIRIAKMLELSFLLAGTLLLVSSVRRAGWPALGALSIPVSLFGAPVLYQGMETSIEVLLLAGLLLSLTLVFVREDRSTPTLALGLVCCVLPWARLETLSISLLALLAVSAHALWTDRRHRNAVLAVWTLFVLSLAVYFVYNLLVFGSPVPISGAVKNYWSLSRFAEEGGYDLVRNVKRYYWEHYRHLMECAVLCGAVSLPWFARSYRGSRYAAHQAIDVFIIILVFGYVSRLIYASAFVHPAYDNQYYYVPYFVLNALEVGYILTRVLLVPEMVMGDQSTLRGAASLVAGAAALLVVGLRAHPWSLPDLWGRSGPAPTWLEASYDGTEWMNRHLPAQAVIGSPDSGVVGYFSRRRVINLDGLVNDKSFFAAMKQQSVEDWINKARVTYLADGVRANIADGCASIAAGSAQTRPYSGSCKLVYQGVRFQQGWRGKLDDMQFRVYAFTPRTAGG